jgi:hypothetical protein
MEAYSVAASMPMKNVFRTAFGNVTHNDVTLNDVTPD